MNCIVISKVVNGEICEIGAFEFDTRQQAESDFNRLKRIFPNSEEKKLDYIVDLRIEHDLVDTISIQQSKADWLINDYFGMAKKVRV